MDAMLIHPGFHKTGTTFLQECVFADRRFFAPVMSHVEADRRIVRPHELQFDAGDLAADLSARRAEAEAGRIPVLSSEILSGNPFFAAQDSVRIAHRLAQACPDARILLTVRAQPAIVKSIYLQYVKRGGGLSLERFLTFEAEPGYPWFDPELLAFDRLSAVYAELFGEDRVMVLPQELLRADRARFLELLFDFAGVQGPVDFAGLDYAGSRGASPPASGTWLLRLSNRLRSTPLSPKTVGPIAGVGKVLHSLAYRAKFGEAKADAAMKAVIGRLARGRFGASNARLQRFCPVDLGKLGYELPAPGSGTGSA